MRLFTEEEIEDKMKDLGGWTSENQKIQKLFKFNDFVLALKFVNLVADIAERDNHHPDILITYNKVMLTLWTHDVGGLSDKDFNLARQIDKVYIDFSL